MKHSFVLHPWHGVERGEESPEILTAFIEIVPSDTVKYEVDKASGILKVDRPQQFSNVFPALYGFVPQTYCAEAVAAFCMEQTDRSGIKGDGDPLDICVLSSVNIPHSNILVKAVPIGGFRMIDKGEADDKIIAVLKQDEVYGNFKTINDCPVSIINRLKHYFLTYKAIPGATNTVIISDTYDADEAKKVIELSVLDYNQKFKSHLNIGV